MSRPGNVYQARSIRRKDNLGCWRTVQLAELSFVFDCPDCEYVMTALTEEGAQTLEHAHMISMPSTHLESLAEALWIESPLSELGVTDAS